MTIHYQSTESPDDLPTHGVFEADGLPPGLGTVIGTAMRRVLLSSVPGTAAVWMSIPGVVHEFATIPGVKEDVQELILGMRGLRLRVRDRAVHRLTLHVKGRDALAGDLLGDGGVEVLNPLYKLATINETGDFTMDLWVQRDRDKGIIPRGMLPDRSEGIPLGMIWLDPIYSPVERVSADVDEGPDSDRLRLDVWTNGTVSPREAVDWAGRILAEMTEDLHRSLNSPRTAPAPIRDAMGQRLEELNLSTRSYNRLKRAHFDTVEEILSRTRRELYATPDLGPKTLMELEEKLAALGLHLRNPAMDDAPDKAE